MGTDAKQGIPGFAEEVVRYRTARIRYLAAGAGPPANKIATRRTFDCVMGGRESGVFMGVGSKWLVARGQWLVPNGTKLVYLTNYAIGA